MRTGEDNYMISSRLLFLTILLVLILNGIVVGKGVAWQGSAISWYQLPNHEYIA